MNLLWHEPGRMAYERFHAVYVQCFCGSICIYIYIRVSWYYILSITSQGAPKSTRAHIYISGDSYTTLLSWHFQMERIIECNRKG